MSKKSLTLEKFQKQWQFKILAEVTIYALSPAILMFLVDFNIVWCIIVFVVLFTGFLFLRKPWKITPSRVGSYLDQNIQDLQYSSALMLSSSEDLSSLARLQQQRVAEQLKNKINSVKPKVDLKVAILSLIGCILVGVCIKYLLYKNLNETSVPNTTSTPVVFKPVDTADIKNIPPEIVDQEVIIYFPNYTGIPARRTSDLNVKVLEGSRFLTKLIFDQKVDSVLVEWNNEKLKMTGSNLEYSKDIIPQASGFYNFQFIDTSGAAYISDLFSVDILIDEAPVLEVTGLQEYTSFQYDEKKSLRLHATIVDDYGIGDTFISATITTGTGESIKFRQQRLEFNQELTAADKQFDLSKTINLDSLSMEPGDELYFHIETRDLKTPRPNITRSETFFAKIEDTISYSYTSEGTLGVDKMPDYFRSQRQLIIDTEKLIEEQATLSKNEFQSRSNELGAEQQALRMKYGKFMGDESAGGEHHDHDHGEENPISDYMHNHDGSNEHNLVEDDAEQAQTDTTGTGSVNKFERSMHTKMRIALGEMWDSELNLRIAEPQESLPYQNRALELLQDIKNAARVYVHRIGFDPPPIKENQRLSGDLEEVNNFKKQEDFASESKQENLKKSIALLESISGDQITLTGEDRDIFRKAGEELAVQAVNSPGNFLSTLNGLKYLSESNEVPSVARLESIQKGLYEALNDPKNNPGKIYSSSSSLNNLIMKALEETDE